MLYFNQHICQNVQGGYSGSRTFRNQCAFIFIWKHPKLKCGGMRFTSGKSCDHRNILKSRFSMARILPGQTDVYALTDSRLSLGRPVQDVACALFESGVKILQYREKKLPGRKMLEECRILRKLADRYGACFIVNDHLDIALLAGADGVHLGQDDISPLDARKLAGPDFIIGLSTHSPEQAREAESLPVDYIGVGPLFATATKEDVCAPVGLPYLDWVTANISIPFVAIGGIKTHNIGEVVRHGAKCCAMVSELVGAEDIGARVAEVRKAMKR